MSTSDRPRDPSDPVAARVGIDIALDGDLDIDLDLDIGRDVERDVAAEDLDAADLDAAAPIEDEHLELDVFDDVVDPRMRERWVATRRAEGQRRLRIIAGAVGFVSVALIAYVAAHSALLGARDIEVKGGVRTSPAMIRAAAGIRDGAPLLFLDEREIVRRVERVPMVDRASVSTDLPSTVTITVTERVPIAWTAAATAPWVAVLDASGGVLERLGTPPTGVLHVVGPKAGPAGTQIADAGLLGGLARMPDALRARTASFRQMANGPVLVLTDTTVGARQVRLGDLTRIKLKAAAALAVLDALARQGDLARYVDVRVPEAPVTRQ